VQGDARRREAKAFNRWYSLKCWSMSDLTAASLEECLRQIKAAAGDKPMQIRPTKIIYRPEDIARIARIRGVPCQQVYDAIRAMADGA
jgi:hypothetical protein